MSEINNEIVIDYKDLTHSNYPRQEDKLMDFHDPSDEEIEWIKEYNSYMSSGRVVDATGVLVQHPSLRKCIINADTLLSLHHSIIAVQRYFYDNVLDKIMRLGNQKGDWNAQMSSDADDESLKLNKFDVVRYPVDGVSQYFLVYGCEIQSGEIPTESEKYLQISMKGDTGEAGYTPIKNIDYFDGASGLGLSPRGAWVNNLDYFQYDMVSHNGYLWYCLEDNIAKEPSVETVWMKIEISMQSSVGSDIPTALEEGGIWLHIQDDGHIIIKTKNADGEYITMFPETQADYVKDVNGKSMQEWLYQHYFEREDVKIKFIDNSPNYTATATLLDTNIVVAKNVLIDMLDDNGTATEELTIYDETGIYVMYKSKKIYTDNGDGTYECVTEVIV